MDQKKAGQKELFQEMLYFLDSFLPEVHHFPEHKNDDI
jgi:hypothetical protein